MVDIDRGDRFEQYASEVWVPLQAYVRRRARRSDVDDVVSETLTVAWRRFDDVPADHAAAWTIGVARRILANHRRGDRRRFALAHRIGAQTPASVEAAGENDPAFDTAMALLGHDDREVLHLWAWEQLEPREMAVVLDVTPNTAAARLSRAKRRLEDLLTRHDRVAAGHDADGATMGPQL